MKEIELSIRRGLCQNVSLDVEAIIIEELDHSDGDIIDL